MSQTGPFGPDPTGSGQPPPAGPGFAPPPGQGPPGWQGQQWQGGYQHYPVPPTNVMAILALVLSFVFAPAGLVLGIIAKGQIRQTGEQGEGLATAAIVISAVFLAVTVIAFIAFFAIAATVVSHLPNNTGFPCNTGINCNTGLPGNTLGANTGIGLSLVLGR